MSAFHAMSVFDGVVTPGVLVWRTFDALYGLAVDCAQGAVNALDHHGLSNSLDTYVLNKALRTLRERSAHASEETTIADVRALHRRSAAAVTGDSEILQRPARELRGVLHQAMTAKAVIAAFTALRGWRDLRGRGDHDAARYLAFRRAVESAWRQYSEIDDASAWLLGRAWYVRDLAAHFGLDHLADAALGALSESVDLMLDVLALGPNDRTVVRAHFESALQHAHRVDDGPSIARSYSEWPPIVEPRP